MGVVHTVLVGYANGAIRTLPVRNHRKVGEIIDLKAREIGKLTRAGFCTVVAAAWHRRETQTAGLLYAADWNQNGVEVLLHHGDRIASSQQLYERWQSQPERPLTSGELIDFCRQLKLD